MKIFLLNPPFLTNFVRCGRWQGVVARGGTLNYPYWLAYSTALLENNGHEVKLVDAIASKWDLTRVVKDATQFQPELIVIDTNFSSLNNDIKIAKLLKAQTGAKTIIVGPPASQFTEGILKQGIDIVARFEYDFTLKEIVSHEINEKNLSSIKGISYILNGKIFHNPTREFSTQKELDEIPFVSQIYKKHLKIKDYFRNDSFFPMVQIITSRGCPNQCTFCAWPETLTGRKYRTRSVDNIILEFQYIVKELPEVREIFIEDDCFTINKKHILDFCAKIIEKGIKIKWSCQARANLDYETMVAMKKAGCRLLVVGYESGSDDILKNIKKGVTVEQLREFTKNAKRAKLKILADFVIGFPGETKETSETTLQFIKEIKPDLLQIAIATPMPGTEFYNFCKEKNFLLVDDIQQSIDNSGFQKCIISYPNLSDTEIRSIVSSGLRDYYFSLNYLLIFSKNLINGNVFQELKVFFKSAIAMIKFFISS